MSVVVVLGSLLPPCEDFSKARQKELWRVSETVVGVLGDNFSFFFADAMTVGPF